MGKLCRELDLAKKPLGADRLRDVGTQHLDRHRAPVAQVARAVDRGHPASSDLGIERVAVAERECHANDVIDGVGSAWRRGRSASNMRGGVVPARSLTRSVHRLTAGEMLREDVAQDSRRLEQALRWSAPKSE